MKPQKQPTRNFYAKAVRQIRPQVVQNKKRDVMKKIHKKEMRAY